MSIDQIIDELTEHDPSLADKGESLKQTVQAMLEEKPEVYLDPDYQSRLKAKLTGSPRFKRRSAAFRVSIAASAAAAVFALVMVGRSEMFRHAPVDELSYLESAVEETAVETPAVDKPAVDKPAAIPSPVSGVNPADRTKGTGSADSGKKPVPGEKRESPVTPSGPAVSGQVPKPEPSLELDRNDAVTETELAGDVEWSETDAQRIEGAPILRFLLAPPGTTAKSQALGSPGMAFDDELMVEPDWNPVEGYSPTDYSGEGYEYIRDNSFLSPLTDPFSTFSADVDTASYSNVRRFLNDGNLPPKDAVRIEELLNYFHYDYPTPSDGRPFKSTVGLIAAPWSPEHQLLIIGIKGREVSSENLPPANLVLLLDVSGSMDEPDKLPLLKRSLGLLVERMRPQDHISIVVYAGAAGVVLLPTSGDEKAVILEALDRLEAGGSTAGGEGLELAYSLAEKNFRKNGNNRIILATDGDFNVGMSSDSELVEYIEKKRDKGIFLSVLGFGTGNYQDGMMEQLADNGNGNFAYIDSISEARKVLVNEMGSTLHTIASDVKFQLEFNPALVDSYRLIGYENRVMAARDFDDDKRDAGEIGAGHTVTALYEIIPIGAAEGGKNKKSAGGDALRSPRYLQADTLKSGELGVLRLRWKNPGSTTSDLSETPLLTGDFTGVRATDDQRFAASVAAWGMLLRDSPHKGSANIDSVITDVKQLLGNDPEGYRAEFLSLLYKTRELTR